MNAMSKNDLSTIRRPSRQPYEVIETLEETITRYYDPTSFGKSIPQTNGIQQIKSDYKRHEERNPSEDNSNLKITFKNIQLQDLYEKFKNLRKVMSEITERFREINMSAQKDNNVSVSTNVADEITERFREINLSAQKDNNVTVSTNVADDQNRYIEGGNIPEISELEEDDEEKQTPQVAMTYLFPKKSITKFSEDFNFDSDVNLQLMQSQTQLSSPKFLNVQAVQDNDNSLIPFKNLCSSRRTNTYLLKKSKKLLISLIDKEIEKTDKGKSKNLNHKHVTMSNNCVRCRIGCIQNICKELDVLKELECFDG